MIPILHPAAIVRGRWGEEPNQILHLKRAKRSEPARYEDVEKPPPGSVIDPKDVGDLYTWSDRIGPLGVAVDIENAGPHIIAVGLCRIDDEVPCVLSFRRGGGSAELTYSATELAERIQWLYSILGDPKIPKVMHNGQAHDVPHLERVGFDVKNYADDTLLIAHVAYPEMRKRLEKLAVLFCGMPRWKQLVDEDEEGDAK